jgi:hypothetical protein
MPARPIRSASAEATLPFLTKGQVSREDGPQGPPSKHLQRISSLASQEDRAATNSTGEFDPGSERTLAARLTHASRTRKGFGPGTVAHG